jgi:RimJ/RimL family protein N-acetyltransferase
MSNQFELELEFRGNRPNYQGFGHPLEFRPLKISDTVLLAPILKKYGKQLSEYLADYTFAADWDFRNANNYVHGLLNQPFPRYSYLFMIGKQIVGMAYTGEWANSIYDSQIVLWVHPNHQGKRIGHAIGHTIRKVMLEIWGMDSFNWVVAETNTPSIKTAESLGLELAEKFIGEIHAKGETGEWRRYVQYRDESVKGILQGEQSLAGWTGNRNASALDAILQAMKRGDVGETKKLAREELARINGEEQMPTDNRSVWEKALEQRDSEMQKKLQQISNKHGRWNYNEQRKKQRKKKNEGGR